MKKIFWCASLLIIGTATNAQTTIELNPIKDNSIYSESENSNGEGQLYAGQNCDDNSRRALLEFDIAAMVPFGATITGVNLTLNMDNVSPGAGTQAYSIHRVGMEWGEGASVGAEDGAEAISPDATWIDAMYETMEWDDEGGEYYSTASATTAVGEDLMDYVWSSPQMITNVQNWLDYPGSNHGWILIGDEAIACTDRRFGSKDEGIAPILEITYTCAEGPAVARCHSLTVYLDDAGEATITADDLDNGSAAPCDGELTLGIDVADFTCDDIAEAAVVPSMILSAVYDGPLTGGTPKGVEVYVINDIEDLSAYGIGFANNGGGSDGEEFTFPSVSADAGTYLFVASENLQFAEWFGFDPDYTDGDAAINGDDAIELFYEGTVIDIFGDIDVDGTGQPWEYMDGWASRIPYTSLDGDVFEISHWTFSGPNELDGESSNATATSPVPVHTYKTDPTTGLIVNFTALGDVGDADSCFAIIQVLDTLAPVMSCVGGLTYVLDETGSVTIDATDLDAGTEDGCGIAEMSISKETFTCADDGINEVWLFATDIYGNSDSCMVEVTIDASDVISILEGDLVDPTCPEFADGIISIDVEGGTPDYTFDWDNDGTGDFDDMEDLSSIPEGTYVVIVMDENGCQATATFELTDPEPITATVEIVNESCPGAGDGSATFTYTGGTGPYAGPTEISDLTAGEYVVTVTDAEGCSVNIDYEVGLDVEIDLTVTTTGSELTSNQDGATYQWVTCPDYEAVDGATDQTFSPEGPGGEYAVIITLEGGCSDTTECYSVGFDHIIENSTLTLSLFPNPTNGLVNLTMGNTVGQSTITVMDLKGSVILQKNTFETTDQIDLSHVETGVYFVKIASVTGAITKKITVTK